MSEESKIAVLNHRREASEVFKEFKIVKEISEDEMFRCQDEVKKITDEFIKKTYETTAEKEKEIMEF